MLINYLDAGRGPASELIYNPAWRWSILVADATHYG
jgi:hypothetical protein